MRRALLASSALFVLALATTAEAASLRMRGVGGSPPVVECAEGAGDDDNGCSTSPGGSEEYLNLFTGLTGETYPVLPDFNVPGYNYKVGMPPISDPAFEFTFQNGYTLTGSCGTATLVDPATVSPHVSSNDPGCGQMPKDCTWSALSGGEAFPILNCNPTSAVVVKGFELGPVGGHGGTYVNFEDSAFQTALAFNNFVGSESHYVRNGWANWEVGNTGDTIIFANNKYGNWEDDWSARGAGTASRAGTTLTIQSCTGPCAFYVGQRVVSGTFNGSLIYEQLSGPLGGSVGSTFRVSTSGTTATTAISTYFSFAGFACNSSGNLFNMYNLDWQTNGRPGTCSMRNTGQTHESIEWVVHQFNFAYGGLYASGQHYEYFEHVNQHGLYPLTFENYIFDGNVIIFPAGVQASSVTGANFVSTGEFNNDQPDEYTLTYDNVHTCRNVIIAINGAEGAAALDSIGGGVAYGGDVLWSSHVNEYTACRNWIRKDATGYYSLGNGQKDGVTAFWRGSQTATTLTVETWQGGDIIRDNTRAYESGVKILSQATNTNGLGEPGKEGTYTMETTCAVSCSVANRRSAPDVISVVNASDNHDLVTGDELTLPSYLSTSSNTASFTYPGMR
jgi:hypothetical protein